MNEDDTDSKRNTSLSLPIQLLKGDLSVYVHLLLLISHTRLTSFINEPSFYQLFGHIIFTFISRSHCFIFIVTALLLFKFIDLSTFVLCMCSLPFVPTTSTVLHNALLLFGLKLYCRIPLRLFFSSYNDSIRLNFILNDENIPYK